MISKSFWVKKVVVKKGECEMRIGNMEFMILCVVERFK